MLVRSLSAALAGALLLAGCAKPAPSGPSVIDAWVRLPALPGRPAAAYFTLKGGNANARLVAIESPQAKRIELHESMKQDAGHMAGMPGMAGGAMMTMRPLAAVDLPAGGTIRFAPGGYHAMLFGLDAGTVAGSRIPLSLRFASGTRLDATAEAVAAGDPAPR